MTTLPVTPAPILRCSVVLTDRRGDLQVTRSPGKHPPACIVRRGDGPAFPMPFIEFGANEPLALELRDLLPRSQ